MNLPKKVLVLGSGALKIGEAGEFDYSGSQCLKALKEEGIVTVLINPNIATIQTDQRIADKIYFLPVNPEFVEKVIEKEKPEGILLGFGGQTALNCGLELEETGILAKHNVKVLGTPVKTIRDTEDRDLFVKRLAEIGLKVPKSIAVSAEDDVVANGRKIGYPVMIRSGFSLGGQGSNVCRNDEELKKNAATAFSNTSQILIEEYLGGWKEVEYEVVRDVKDNCITVCNMENFDPLGIHTGESIVIAPSQTLTNYEYHMLRDISIRAIKHLGVIGECNIQFALNPESEEYRIIEVNSRLSRSSALASKATGYPLAFVAAKLSLGYTLPELRNSITKSTTACFEPALDYVVVKIPRWDLKKFKNASRIIGSGMKSVGEVMAIGRTFEEAIQKALRMLDIGMHGFAGNNIIFDSIENEIKVPTDERIFAIAEALRKGFSPEKINLYSSIDLWFLHKLSRIIETEKKIKHEMTPEILLKAKQMGFSDKQISIITGKSEKEVRVFRKLNKIRPVVKQIDTLAAEYPAKTNYLYLTYNGTEDDIVFDETNAIMVLGSGTYRIGSSVEFDWCCVNAVVTLRELGHKTIMLNYNPETVSTDYDECDRLYFDEISFETVAEIYEKEKPAGIIISMGGQIPNSMATKLQDAGLKILGTNPASIDNAEDRYKFSSLLDRLGVSQPEWEELTSPDEAKKFAGKVGYPVLVRPSYVLSGAAMSVAENDDDLDAYLTKASKVNAEYPVVISKYIINAREIELDAVAADGKMAVWAISEHVENAGVHSGDATLVLPPQKTYLETIRRVKKIGTVVADALKITGPFNIQFIAKEGMIMVIECNLRASRSFPFVSKVMKTNFIDLATKIMLGKDVSKEIVMHRDFTALDHVGVKAPQFSFSRLIGADPITGVEMASTGEVACLGEDFDEALLKSMIAVGFKIPKKRVLISIGAESDKIKMVDSAKKLHDLGLEICATEKTSALLEKEGIKNTKLYKISEKKQPNIYDYLTDKKLDLVINIPKGRSKQELSDGYIIRRTSADFHIPLITNLQLARAVANALSTKKFESLLIKSWEEY